MNRIILFLSLSVCFISCNKPGDPVPEWDKDDYSNGYPLRVGNYWIYRSTTYFSSGFVQVFPHTDSAWIEKDTVVGGKIYYLLKSTNRSPALVRDSGGYVLEKYFESPVPVFSRYNHEDTLLKAYPYYRIMTDIGDEVTVPAGTFKTINCKTLMKLDPNDPGGAHGFPMHDLNFHLHDERIYANNVGRVKFVTFYVGNRNEENLEKYYVRK